MFSNPKEGYNKTPKGALPSNQLSIFSTNSYPIVEQGLTWTRGSVGAKLGVHRTGP